MRQRNQDTFTIHICMVYSQPKLITDLILTIYFIGFTTMQGLLSQVGQSHDPGESYIT